MILHHFIFIFTLKKKKHIGRFTFYGNFFFIILKYRPVFGNGKCRFGVVLIVLMCVSAKGEGRIVGASELVGGHNCHFLFLSAFAFLGCSLTQCVRDVFIN